MDLLEKRVNYLEVRLDATEKDIKIRSELKRVFATEPEVIASV